MIPNAAQQLAERFGAHTGRSYIFAPFTTKNIGRHYRLQWVVGARKVTPGDRKAHRQPVREIAMVPVGGFSKYTPHQGKREMARRVARG